MLLVVERWSEVGERGVQPTEQTAVFPGRYVQAEGALEELADEVQRLGANALLVVGRTAADRFGRRRLSRLTCNGPKGADLRT